MLALHNIVDYTEAPLVSIDFNRDPHSAIVDGSQTEWAMAIVKMLVWCDNEWGFAEPNAGYGSSMQASEGKRSKT